MTKLANNPFVVFLLLFSGVSNLSLAQSVIFAKSFTETGEGLGKRNVWYADSSESRIAIIFNNGRQTINSHKLFLDIKLPNDSVIKMTLKVGSNKNWVADYFEFLEIGKYTVCVKDEKGYVLAISDVFLRGNAEKNVEDDSFKMNNADKTAYFALSRIAFGDGFKEGKLINEGNTFKVEGKGKYIAVLLSSNDSLGTTKLMMDVWKKRGDDQAYNEHIDAKEFKVDSKSKMANFHYSFRKPGDYKISVFTKDFVWINSAYIRIVGN